MKGNKKIFYLIYILLILICSACNNKVEECVVKINDEYIYKYEIDRVYSQFESNEKITYDKIINDTIDEILVIQASKDWNIDVTDIEVKKSIDQYKENYSEIYKKAIDIYGEKDFQKGQKDRMIYNKTKEKVLESLVNSKSGFTNQQIEEFIQYYNIQNELKDFDNNDIISYYSKEIKDFIFDQWIRTLKNNAQITYYQ